MSAKVVEVKNILIKGIIIMLASPVSGRNGAHLWVVDLGLTSEW